MVALFCNQYADSLVNEMVQGFQTCEQWRQSITLMEAFAMDLIWGFHSPMDLVMTLRLLLISMLWHEV